MDADVILAQQVHDIFHGVDVAGEALVEHRRDLPVVEHQLEGIEQLVGQTAKRGDQRLVDLEDLLEPRHVDDAIAAATGSGPTALDDTTDRAPGVDSLAVCVPAALKRTLGVSVDTAFEHGGREVAPTGLNVVGDGERVAVSTDAALAVNVNRPADLAVARERAGGHSSRE